MILTALILSMGQTSTTTCRRLYDGSTVCQTVTQQQYMPQPQQQYPNLFAPQEQQPRRPRPNLFAPPRDGDDTNLFGTPK